MTEESDEKAEINNALAWWQGYKAANQETQAYDCPYSNEGYRSSWIWGWIAGVGDYWRSMQP